MTTGHVGPCLRLDVLLLTWPFIFASRAFRFQMTYLGQLFQLVIPGQIQRISNVGAVPLKKIQP